MSRVIASSVALLTLTLSAICYAQSNVIVHPTQRYAEQARIFHNSNVAPMLSDMMNHLGPGYRVIVNECGVANAFYRSWEKSITLCYEYLYKAHDYFQYRYTKWPEETKAIWKRGILIYVLFHEFGHALIDAKQYQGLGGEEDAADRVAIIMMLALAKKNPAYGKEMIKGNLIYQWHTRPKALAKLFSGLSGKNIYADEHPLNEQRVFNMVCLAYGSNPSLYYDLATEFKLPKDRATRCQKEYLTAREALNELLESGGWGNTLRQLWGKLFGS